MNEIVYKISRLRSGSGTEDATEAELVLFLTVDRPEVAIAKR